MKADRNKELLDNALEWIYEHTEYFGEEEYFRVCKEHIGMTDEEIEEQKQICCYED